jgi:hypothetical protein
MTTVDIQSRADYAEALISARTAKLLLFIVLLATLLIQLTYFFLVRYPRLLQSAHVTPPKSSREIMQYIVGGLDFVGMIGSMLFAIVLLLLLHIQLAARVVGVGRVTSAFIGSVGIALLLFPWQAVLNNPTNDHNPLDQQLGLKVPGVLYTWAEVSHPKLGATFEVGPEWTDNVLHWARYVAFPLATLILLVVVQVRSSRGVGQSLAGPVV